ncbi:hypothetical protein SKAU_G00341600 [Synaphobranchus kaupii]|uniref:Serine protease n=1 Tax=Synaphobranchus kaupii TaxID=118154 RepID=A0A9Q1EN40_SYNKA|nr:hypothetical protein SKAU_G00341600 [Synaphobranchus kaupii]
MASNNTCSKMKNEPLESQEEHKTTHTFSFCQPDGPCSISCTTAGTVLEALKTSETFTSLVSDNKTKDIVIVRKTPQNADIAPHFPCWLIGENEVLTIQFTPKNNSDPAAPNSDPAAPNIVTEEQTFVTFYVDRTGGKNCLSKPFLKNMKIKDIHFLCIYARERETVEEALRNDGRFLEITFGKGNKLICDDETRMTVEMSRKVDITLDKKTFKLKMRSKKKAEPSESARKTDAGPRIADQATAPAQEQAGKSTPGSSKSAPAKPPAPAERSSAFHVIPDSEELLKILRSQFKGLLEHMKGREKGTGNKKVLKLLREEFSNNTDEFSKVRTMRNLMEMAKSVCQIIINGEFMGTGFLLFDRFILTNAHIFKGVAPQSNIQVNFHHEIDITSEHNLPIKQVIASAYGKDEHNCLDYALFELDENVTEDLPPPLLKQYCSPIQIGGLCIIGHPERGLKKYDHCSIIDYTHIANEYRESAVDTGTDICQWIKWNMSTVLENRTIPYETCFYGGSSGSPVFSVTGKVVGMHSGGFKEPNTESVIEFAHPLSSILKDILRKLATKPMPDVLTKFIEEAKTQDALHPVIADFIMFLGRNYQSCHRISLEEVINTVERDAHSREHCWINILETVSENVQQELKTWLVNLLDETQKNDCKLYQLLVQGLPMQCS